MPVFSVQVKAMTAAAHAQQTTTRLKGARGTPPAHSFHGTVCCASQAAAELEMLLWLLLLTHSGVSSCLCAAAATWPAATATTAPETHTRSGDGTV